MRWVVVAILAYACLVVQTAVFRPGLLGLEIRGHEATPDLVLVFGLFIALSFEPYEVFLAGWCLGLGADLIATYPDHRLGLGALLFAVVLYLTSYLQGSLFRGRVVVQFLLSLLVVFVVHWVWGLAARLGAGAALEVGRTAAGAALDGVYSAVLAPYLFWLFFRFKGPLRLPPGGTLD